MTRLNHFWSRLNAVPETSPAAYNFNLVAYTLLFVFAEKIEILPQYTAREDANILFIPPPFVTFTTIADSNFIIIRTHFFTILLLSYLCISIRNQCIILQFSSRQSIPYVVSFRFTSAVGRLLPFEFQILPSLHRRIKSLYGHITN